MSEQVYEWNSILKIIWSDNIAQCNIEVLWEPIGNDKPEQSTHSLFEFYRDMKKSGSLLLLEKELVRLGLNISPNTKIPTQKVKKEYITWLLELQEMHAAALTLTQLE